MIRATFKSSGFVSVQRPGFCLTLGIVPARLKDIALSGVNDGLFAVG
jgi:hypothetical protein